MVSGIYSWKAQYGTEQEPNPKALADRARREAMPDTRDLTGRLLGDPPAGRSALDRKREREIRAVYGPDEEQEHADG